MSYNIQQPSVPNADDKWSAAEHNGALMLFFPTEIRRGIKTSNGDADAVACSRVVNLNSGRVLHNTLIFGTALVPNIGGGAPDGVVLGRLAQGVAKNGNNPPWILQPHDENDLRVAQQWLAMDAQNQLQQPAPQSQAQQGGWGQQAPSGQPAQGGWGQQAAAPAPASPAPATGGWGNPPAQQYGSQNAPTAGWGAPAAATPAPAPSAGAPDQGQFAGQWGAAQPAAPQIDPGLLAALEQRGVPRDQVQNQAHAEQIAASMGLTRQ